MKELILLMMELILRAVKVKQVNILKLVSNHYIIKNNEYMKHYASCQYLLCKKLLMKIYANT